MLSSLSISVDGQGDVLVTGTFEGTISFGRKTFAQQGQNPQLFLAKFSSMGELLWCNCPGDDADVTRATSGVAAGTGSTDGAFSWLEPPAAESPSAEPAQVPELEANAIGADGPEVDRDSFEPVWLAEPEADGTGSAADESAEWRSRVGRGLGYSMGFAGAASAVGVLVMALLNPPAGDWGDLSPAPAAVGSLLAGQVSGEVAPEIMGPQQGAIDEDPPLSTPTGTPQELRAKTLALLTRGDATGALPLARALVAADPHHALSYLCLGAALIDLGRRPEAQQIFSQCVRQAKRGDRSECAALGGRRSRR